MGIPDEDLGPAWLRDYGSLHNIGDQSATGDGGTGVRADLPAMQDFAAALEKNLYADYEPHARKVLDDMAVLPEGTPSFAELDGVLTQQREVNFVASDNLANHGTGALRFARAMNEISQNYARSDAFAAASLNDVQRHLGLSPDQPATTNPTPSQAGGA